MQKENYIVRVAVTPYILLIVIFGPLLYPLVTVPNLIASIISGGIVALFLYYFNLIKISIYNDRLVFRRKEILFSDIKRVSMNMDLQVKTPSGRRVPVYGILIWGSVSDNEPLAMIPSKIYGKKDLMLLLNTLSKSNSNIQLDDLCKTMSAGDFGTITKIGLGKVLPLLLWLMIIVAFIPIIVNLFK